MACFNESYDAILSGYFYKCCINTGFKQNKLINNANSLPKKATY